MPLSSNRIHIMKKVSNVQWKISVSEQSIDLDIHPIKKYQSDLIVTSNFLMTSVAGFEASNGNRYSGPVPVIFREFLK